MKLRGGYDILLKGKPGREMESLPEPRMLYLPLRSKRFNFSENCVRDGERVIAGQVLARDPANHLLPLLAPRAGTARLGAVAEHLILEDIGRVPEEPRPSDAEAPHVSKEVRSADEKRGQLLELGAWQFVCDAHTGELPDPFGTPRAVIVSTVRLEPFVARGDVQLYEQLPIFIRGLEHLQSLLEYQPMYLVMPDTESAFARHVREMLRGYAWIKLVEVPLRYPYDDFTILARGLGLMKESAPKKDAQSSSAMQPSVSGPNGPVWALRTEGVLAIDRALTHSLPCTSRVVSVGGPAVESPNHVKAIPGYPLKAILGSRLSTGRVRVVNGGALTGEIIGEEQLGLDVECSGLTVLPDETEREFLGFARPGWSRRSYSRCFPSSLRRPFAERLTTGLRGERRACISCNFCEEVCPAGIMPHLIHKYLYQGALEETERARVDLCVECGLCSLVCPSKIELLKQFSEAKERIRRELEEAAAGREAER
jgi:Na+-transporting NADH:ubiquinone oxidoreductase subunit A